MPASRVLPGPRAWEGLCCPRRGVELGPVSHRHFNDESPLGLRRILSQSTDSLNMRNRALSVESLIDEGERASPGPEGRWGRKARGPGKGIGSELSPLASRCGGDLQRADERV